MTPHTDDMIDQWAGRRQSSYFATSAAPSSFSPKSSSDYDFPTGTHLPPMMNGFHGPTSPAVTFLEEIETPQAGCYSDPAQLAEEARSSCTPMNWPPYPPQILHQNGDNFPEPYLDPHVLNINMAMPEEAYLTSEDVLMNYGGDLQVPASEGIPSHNALTPIQEHDYFNTHDHANPYGGQSPVEEIQQDLPHSTGIQSPESANRQGLRQPKLSQRSLARRASDQVGSGLKTNNQCPICNKAYDTESKLRKHIHKEHDRPYPCIFAQYGCNSNFGTKNEWARHVKVQHLRLETWRCDIDECKKHTNDEDRLSSPSASKGKCEYDRKDLFLNHVRRCHRDQYPLPGIIEGKDATAYEDRVQQDCHRALRRPPMQTRCPCCPGTIFDDFDACLDHMGRSMEANEEARAGFHDPDLEAYMTREGLLQWSDSVGWLLTGAEGKKGGRQARRGSHHQRQLTSQARLITATEGHGTSLQPAKKSKRVELKRKKQQQQQQQLRRQQADRPEKENTSDEDAEADDDDDYQGP